MTLLHPWALLLALLVPLAYGLRRRRGTPSLLFSAAALLRHEPLPRSWRARLHPVPGALEAAGLLFVVVALARPVERVPVPHVTEGIDILLCLDVSSSMTANDLDTQRTRLDVAKEAASRFIAGRPDDRIGLVCFARYPDLRCPPTPDHRALGELIAGVTLVANDGPEDATGIGTAVARAAQVLQASTARSRVVILLTDGEENVATARKPDEIAPVHAGQLCAELGVRAYTIVVGLGSRDRTGRWTPLDTRQVRRLAERTGGRFFEARDAGAVAAVYAEIDALEKAGFDEPRYRVDERFAPFLLVALGLLVAGRLLRATVLAVLP